MSCLAPLVARWAASSAAGSKRLAEVASLNPGVSRVVLKKGKAQIFVTGNPMVFSGAIDRIIGRPPPKTGDLVLVTNGAEEPIAWGVYNAVSMFRVRVLQTQDEAARDPHSNFDIEKLIETRLSGALALRKALGLPSSETNVYRLVNSEGDRLSGLVVDVFDKHIVVASSAAWVEKYKTNIEETLKRLVGTKLLTWRPSVELLKEEGFECVIESEERPEEVHVSSLIHLFIEGFSDGFFSDTSLCCQVLENGIAYQVSLGGQKTGFYVDQRDNRLALRSFCKDKTILDLCCYTGAFALNAAITGASRVIGVDSSKSAIDLADANISLNNIDPQVITFEKADIVQYMKAALSKGETWDVVVLDPPKLAPSRKFLEKAAIKYRNLNAMAMQLTKPGGLLMTCSCSGAVAQSQNFLSIIQEAARAAGRKAALLRVSGAGPDHPIDLAYPEGSYLTNCLLRVI
ncbi:uncharacterized protein LOC9642425 isoform X1 [Selaginella moellendorffii]|uniref:uncharacterized protein LOC9642425 isoform X1 n=1 Tax=Selaginella moellendorffii TaxID=88036 RepID=UPI000D1C7A94|nr:uncharacterized protein LOC9642425 isoform X1 [Selaginella moellendorffii]|eukprot:XP_024534252.1 uncharacterized protein LOC9642425 isoform X1 [Selaginella moellendorffii]